MKASFRRISLGSSVVNHADEANRTSPNLHHCKDVNILIFVSDMSHPYRTYNDLFTPTVSVLRTANVVGYSL